MSLVLAEVVKNTSIAVENSLMPAVIFYLPGIKHQASDQ